MFLNKCGLFANIMQSVGIMVIIIIASVKHSLIDACMYTHFIARSEGKTLRCSYYVGYNDPHVIQPAFIMP